MDRNDREKIKIYLMSVKPKYAYRIFAGMKKFELRRWFGIRPEPGSIVVVYVSGNIKAIVGEFIVGKVVYGTPKKVWDYVQSIPESGIYPEDRVYIDGDKPAMAIEVLKPRLYRKPIKIDEIRRIIPDFFPPMSFRELDRNEPLYKLLIRRLRLTKE